MCAGENDNEEPTNMYCPLCWKVIDKDPGGFKKKKIDGVGLQRTRHGKVEPNGHNFFAVHVMMSSSCETSSSCLGSNAKFSLQDRMI